ncbi:MAG TPA: hypothetical protein VFH97_05645 [Gemmatimonadales bacterium]|nr:hypothetical protein [Gemmatimonadales bacterium]
MVTIGDELSTIEGQLIRLTREGSGGERSLDEVIAELSAFAERIRPHFFLIQEALERRDLAYDVAARIEEMRKRVLWLYRRSRLEQVFYSKLRLERLLRDTLYRQVLETYDEFSAMEALEARLRGLSDDLLAAELLHGAAEGQAVAGGAEVAR